MKLKGIRRVFHYLAFLKSKSIITDLERAHDRERKRSKRDKKRAIENLKLLNEQRVKTLVLDYERKLAFQELTSIETIDELHNSLNNINEQLGRERAKVRSAYSSCKVAKEKFMGYQSQGLYLIDRLDEFKQGIVGGITRLESEMKLMHDEINKESITQIKDVKKAGRVSLNIVTNPKIK